MRSMLCRVPPFFRALLQGPARIHPPGIGDRSFGIALTLSCLGARSGCGTELVPLPVTPEENKIAVYLGMFRAYDFVMFLIHWWMKGSLRIPDSSSGAF